MILEIEKEKCSGCSMCQNICPVSCISMKSDEEGFWYPKIDNKKCIQCNKCEKSCPAIKKVEQNDEPRVWAAYNTDETIRMKSSSGGIFFYLAEKTILEGGVVFGAAYNEEFLVKHIWIEKIEEISRLMESKYVQSDIGFSYRKVLEYLNVGRKVLFTGTPCQMAGLKAYLGREYDNLIMVDIICHGTPSPKIWKDYVGLLKRKNGDIKKINFRNKETGWSKYSFKVSFENGNSIREQANCNKYMNGFLTNIYLRPSCYTCQFKGYRRYSDITLADFWGIEQVEPRILNDNKGISMILTNSNKGLKFLEINCRNKINCIEVCDTKRAINENPAAIQSVQKSKNREKFFVVYKKYGLEKALNKYCRYSMKRQVWIKLKVLIYKLLVKIGIING